MFCESWRAELLLAMVVGQSADVFFGRGVDRLLLAQCGRFSGGFRLRFAGTEPDWIH